MIYSKVKTSDKDEEIKAYSVEEYNPEWLHFSKVQRNKKVYKYANKFGVLDTETSHIDDKIGWIYQWAFKLGDDYVYGRKPSEFITLLQKLGERYNLHTMKKIIIYVHNLAYDIQYLKRHLIEYDPKIKMFALDNHAVLIVDVFGFRFLCSYKLSNMSLDLFSKNYAAKYRKAVGEINYNIVRYQDEVLTDSDWYYMFSDVASQYDAIQGYLKVMGYEYAYQAPYTSTGFVRLDCRHTSEKEGGWHAKFTESALNLEQYNLCRQAFMGGLTIANYKYIDTTVRECEEYRLRHKDFTSSYPARQMCNYMPVGRPMWYGEIDDMDEFESLLSDYCCIFVLTMHNVRIKQGITAPYIPSSKCIELKDELKLNGKVVFAKDLSIVVTELDYKWIKKQYETFDDQEDTGYINITKMLLFEKGEAPKWLKDRVMYYFNNKCTLKHTDAKLYAASKALLNAIYGMSATSIIRRAYHMNADGLIEADEMLTDEEMQRELDKYYKSYNNFIPYQLGVYTTAHARDGLMTMIETIGYDNFLYCDTDSAFYKSTPEVEKRLDQMNEDIKKLAIEKNAYIDNQFLGLATDEEPIRAFRSLHAKCYAIEEFDGNEYKLKVTIAGVPKKSTKWINGVPVTRTNAEELGDIDNLNDGFMFRHCGGTRCIYNEMDISTELVNGHITEFSSSAIIENIEKEISDTMYTVGKDYSLLDVKFTQAPIE